MSTERIKVIICGGHLSPALAVIEEIKQQHKPWEVLFVGRKYALEGSRAISEEYRLVTEQDIPFISLICGRITRSMTVYGIFSILKIPVGFLQSLLLIFKFKPTIIISFGGYVAAPVVIAGRLLGIPAATHEQTLTIGLTNRIISKFCQKIFVSFPELTEVLPKNKAVYTGLPLRHGLFHPPDKPSFAYDATVPIIYITGGTTGALTLNELVFPIITDLTKHYMVIHQIGRESEASLERARKLQEKLPQKEKIRYFVAQNLNVQDVAWIYSAAALVIGRSGANTVYELATFGKAAIFVPLPWSAGDEQRYNGQFLERHGTAVVIDQTRVTSRELSSLVSEVFAKMENYKLNANRLAKDFPHNGATRVVDEVSKIIHS